MRHVVKVVAKGVLELRARRTESVLDQRIKAKGESVQGIMERLKLWQKLRVGKLGISSNNHKTSMYEP